jgi:adenylylsulfate kinase
MNPSRKPRLKKGKTARTKAASEKWKRSLVKAVSYRLVIMVLDFTAIRLFTGRSDVAFGFVIVSNVYTTIAYFLHERMWNRIKWGLG